MMELDKTHDLIGGGEADEEIYGIDFIDCGGCGNITDCSTPIQFEDGHCEDLCPECLKELFQNQPA